LLRRRECLVPSWQGWLLAAVVGALMVIGMVRGLYPFLAITNSIPGGVLVVEGWQSDYVLEQAIAEFRRNPYTKLYATGGPISRGAPLCEYKTQAEAAAVALIRLGLDPRVVQAVPSAAVRKDRTYAAACALKAELQQHNPAVTNINIVGIGPHSRRTRRLFAQALGPSYCVGVMAVEPREYDPRAWWRSSAGFRSVTDELIAYVYAVLFFLP
jgi:hypothetical protein